MFNIAQVFDTFMKRLELTEAERDKVSKQQNELRSRLRDKLSGITRDVLVGSYARKTAIRPLNDVDLFLELDPEVHSARRGSEPQLLLEDVQRALRACYPSTTIASGPATRIQGRSVNIEFTSTGIGYDVIPAFRVRGSGSSVAGDHYKIPNRNRQNWIKTNPEVHIRLAIEANTRAGGMLNRLIKAAKHWNRTHASSAGDKPLRSFHLEVMAYEAFQAKPRDERRGLQELFAFLSSRINSPCSDPARLGPNLDADLTSQERRLAQQKLQEGAEIALKAIHHEELGQDQETYKLWRQLLGPEFKSPTQ
jgi:predicted nucleotidyltransferase